jgi:transcription initiation factor TFIID TATA-box-binding protein
MSDQHSKNSHSAKYRIENIVISVNLHATFDLTTISQSYHDAEFNLNRFPGLCIRLTKPKSTILLFKNGKMIITGLKNSQEAITVVDRIITKLKNIGIQIPENPEIKIVNLVISINLQQRINLDKASLLLMDSIYEPEVFPGIILHVDQPIKCVFLLFSSGKVILTGLKKEEDIIPAIKFLGTQLKTTNILK